MSVINKMLRDLDARRVDGAVADRPRLGSPTAMQGTVSLQQTRPAARLLRSILLPLLLLATALAATWYLGLWEPPVSSDVPQLARADLPAAVPVPAASAPVTGASVPAELADAPSLARERRSAPGPVPVALAEPVRAPVQTNAAAIALTPPARTVERIDKQDQPQVAASTTVRAPLPQAAASAAVPLPPLPRPVPPVTRPVTPDTDSAALANTLPQRRQAAAQETLAQAQALWTAGSREAALDLVRETVGAVERAQPVDVALLGQLVREQVRMELAQGRPAAVLAVLSRLDGALSGQADLWAVRGNAAQRLGRHDEAVKAYQAALKLRPGESRWMLGAAVSWAALGQLDTAAQQAEQARALGPVSPEVLTYLRQAGVPLR